MKLYFSPASPYVRKVMVAAHEKGLADRIELLPSAASPMSVVANSSHTFWILVNCWLKQWMCPSGCAASLLDLGFVTQNGHMSTPITAKPSVLVRVSK